MEMKSALFQQSLEVNPSSHCPLAPIEDFAVATRMKSIHLEGDWLQMRFTMNGSSESKRAALRKGHFQTVLTVVRS